MTDEPQLHKAIWVSLSGHLLVLLLVVGFGSLVRTHIPTPIGAKAINAYLADSQSLTPLTPNTAEPAPAPPVAKPEPTPPKTAPLVKPVPPEHKPTPAVTPPKPVKPDDLLVKSHPIKAPVKEPIKPAVKETEKPAVKLTPKQLAEQRAAELKHLADQAAKLNAVQQALNQDKAQAQAAAKAKSQRVEDLNASLSREEEHAGAVASGALGRYAMLLKARFERNWVKPASAKVGLRCEVKVTQVPGGVVTMVKIGSCNGDPSVEQSIIDAVYRSSPLPPPEDMNVFERQFTVIFAPNQ